MNAAGLKVMSNHLATMIESPSFFDQVTNHGISASELKGTRQLARELAKSIHDAPVEKIEALLAHYHEPLNTAYHNFEREWQPNRLKGFHLAQIYIGLVTSLCRKTGVHA